jgi:hypothetical protein
MGESLWSRRDRLPDHTVPYGTVLSTDTFPGTSCLATIMLSLWDKIHSADRGPLAGEFCCDSASNGLP